MCSLVLIGLIAMGEVVELAARFKRRTRMANAERIGAFVGKIACVRASCASCASHSAQLHAPSNPARLLIAAPMLSLACTTGLCVQDYDTARAVGLLALERIPALESEGEGLLAYRWRRCSTTPIEECIYGGGEQVP